MEASKTNNQLAPWEKEAKQNPESKPPLITTGLISLDLDKFETELAYKNRKWVVW